MKPKVLDGTYLGFPKELLCEVLHQGNLKVPPGNQSSILTGEKGLFPQVLEVLHLSHGEVVKQTNQTLPRPEIGACNRLPQCKQNQCVRSAADGRFSAGFQQRGTPSKLSLSFCAQIG